MSTMLTQGHNLQSHARAIRTRGQRIKRADRRKLKRDFLRLFPRHETVKATCKQLGIGRTTFYGWLLRDTDFADKYNGLVAARFDAEMARLDASIDRTNNDEFWQMLPEPQLIRAATRMMSREAREAFYGR